MPYNLTRNTDGSAVVWYPGATNKLVMGTDTYIVHTKDGATHADKVKDLTDQDLVLALANSVEIPALKFGAQPLAERSVTP